jgi:DNA-directed RNA polymerase specialized sigma24 family protein
MTSPSPAAGPEDADALARRAADRSESEAVRHGALDSLVPTIGRVARRVALRFSGQTRQDLVDGAIADIWEALQQAPPTGPFESWCYAVLRNRHLDRVRHEQAESRHAAVAARHRPEAEDVRAAVERAADSRAQVHAGDLQLIATWPLRQRIVLLCLTGLWIRIKPSLWQQWVADYRQAYGSPVLASFPPPELQDCEEIAQRNGILAAALNLRRNTLSVWLHRGKPLLLDLQCVRELLPTSPGGAQP